MIEIKSVYGDVLYVAKNAQDVRSAVEEAVRNRADLRSANLYSANLCSADLRSANLYSADLRSANLRSANLYSADLRSANLYSADLRSANLDPITAAQLSIVPEEGSFIGWKKCAYGKIVKLKVPARAKRSNATGRKCRVSEAKVLAIFNPDRTPAEDALSSHDIGFRYEVGATVKPTEPFSDDRWSECAPGIHLFISRVEAENY